MEVCLWKGVKLPLSEGGKVADKGWLLYRAVEAVLLESSVCSSDTPNG